MGRQKFILIYLIYWLYIWYIFFNNFYLKKTKKKNIAVRCPDRLEANLQVSQTYLEVKTQVNHKVIHIAVSFKHRVSVGLMKHWIHFPQRQVLIGTEKSEF